MKTSVVFFIASLFISLIVTPCARKLSPWLRALDHPGERKIHNGVIPRCGGLALYVGFFLPFLASFLIDGLKVPVLYESSRMIYGFCTCSTLIMMVGLWDDISGLGARTKLPLQVLVAGAAWWSGFRFDGFILPYVGSIELDLLSLPFTIFWFVAVINAINLVDGLDGLAAGIALFVSIVLAALSLVGKDYTAGLMFLSFSGALLGFLRYNFNPASIFLGDSGSYFVGFVLAALGLWSSQKSPITVAILIPIVALGLPLMEVSITPIRRFLFGVSIFSADQEHFHHRFLQLGFTPRRIALVFYAITIMLGVIALLLTSIRDDRVGLILASLAVASIIAVRRLGYLDYITTDKVLDWFADITDETGLNRDRRTFLSNQVAISRSENIYEFWYRIVNAAQKINLNAVILELQPDFFDKCAFSTFSWENGISTEPGISENGHYFVAEVPLLTNGKTYGTLQLKKSIELDGYNRVLFRRIEHLRRTVTDALENLAVKSLSYPNVLQDRRNTAPNSEHSITRKISESGKCGDCEERRFFYNPQVRGWRFYEDMERKGQILKEPPKSDRQQ